MQLIWWCYVYSVKYGTQRKLTCTQANMQTPHRKPQRQTCDFLVPPCRAQLPWTSLCCLAASFTRLSVAREVQIAQCDPAYLALFHQLHSIWPICADEGNSLHQPLKFPLHVWLTVTFWTAKKKKKQIRSYYTVNWFSSVAIQKSLFSFVVAAGEKKRSLGRDYHPLCLKCQKCNRQLTAGQHAEVLKMKWGTTWAKYWSVSEQGDAVIQHSVFQYDERPYCSHCYMKMFGPRGITPFENFKHIHVFTETTFE